MRQTPLEQKLTRLVEPVIADLGFSLVTIKILGEAAGMVVQIMAENPETRKLPIEACASISRAVSAAMDVEDPINGRYTLEVSSPGIDRPLTRLTDFETYKGYEAKLESDMPAENGQRKFRGRLQGLDGEQVMIVTEQGEAKIPYSALTRAKLVLTDELIKATANN
jgi:ribosome maturation factor RimP